MYGPLAGSLHTPKWMHHTGVDRKESNITISNKSSGCNKVLKSTTTGAETNSASVFSSSFFKHFLSNKHNNKPLKVYMSHVTDLQGKMNTNISHV